MERVDEGLDNLAKAVQEASDKKANEASGVNTEDSEEARQQQEELEDEAKQLEQVAKLLDWLGGQMKGQEEAADISTDANQDVLDASKKEDSTDEGTEKDRMETILNEFEQLTGTTMETQTLGVDERAQGSGQSQAESPETSNQSPQEKNIVRDRPAGPTQILDLANESRPTEAFTPVDSGPASDLDSGLDTATAADDDSLLDSGLDTATAADSPSEQLSETVHPREQDRRERASSDSAEDSKRTFQALKDSASTAFQALKDTASRLFGSNEGPEESANSSNQNPAETPGPSLETNNQSPTNHIQSDFDSSEGDGSQRPTASEQNPAQDGTNDLGHNAGAGNSVMAPSYPVPQFGLGTPTATVIRNPDGTFTVSITSTVPIGTVDKNGKFTSIAPGPVANNNVPQTEAPSGPLPVPHGGNDTIDPDGPGDVPPPTSPDTEGSPNPTTPGTVANNKPSTQTNSFRPQRVTYRGKSYTKVGNNQYENSNGGTITLKLNSFKVTNQTFSRSRFQSRRSGRPTGRTGRTVGCST